MKLLVLYDRDSGDLTAKVKQLGEGAGFEVKTTGLISDDIEPCKGCFHCWIKTPGICAITNDGVNETAKDFINADVVVFLSQVAYGCYSPDIKAFLDRSIQNMSPYFEMIAGEMHHKPRYAKYPNWINIGYGEMTDAEAETFQLLTRRNALNFFTEKSHCLIIRHPSDIIQLQEILEGRA